MKYTIKKTYRGEDTFTEITKETAIYELESRGHWVKGTVENNMKSELDFTLWTPFADYDFRLTKLTEPCNPTIKTYTNYDA